MATTLQTIRDNRANAIREARKALRLQGATIREVMERSWEVLEQAREQDSTLLRTQASGLQDAAHHEATAVHGSNND